MFPSLQDTQAREGVGASSSEDQASYAIQSGFDIGKSVWFKHTVLTTACPTFNHIIALAGHCALCDCFNRQYLKVLSSENRATVIDTSYL